MNIPSQRRREEKRVTEERKIRRMEQSPLCDLLSDIQRALIDVPDDLRFSTGTIVKAKREERHLARRID